MSYIAVSSFKKHSKQRRGSIRPHHAILDNALQHDGRIGAFFYELLESLHGAKRSQFTSKLLASLDTFLPSKVDKALDVDIFPEIDALRNADWSSVVIDTAMKERVFKSSIE